MFKTISTQRISESKSHFTLTSKALH
jgi:hypothetical protein